MLINNSVGQHLIYSVILYYNTFIGLTLTGKGVLCQINSSVVGVTNYT